MPAALAYPDRLVLKPGFLRDLYCDFATFAEIVPVGSTSARGEAGEGQTVLSGTATLAWEDGGSPAVPITLASSTATVSGSKLLATVTVPSNATVGTYSILWIAVTSAGKQVSARIYYDVKYA